MLRFPSKLVSKIFGSRNKRLIKKYSKAVIRINQLEQNLGSLSDQDLTHKTLSFKERVKSGETLDHILPEAFAVVREAGKRSLKMRHFDVQLIGGMALHEGKVAEMGTGEGKTLVSTLPAYLNALSGKSVHIITVNDYLAKRDAEWMSPLYTFLGMTVGVILPNMPHAEKQKAYAADIVYGTNNEYGFDYLRDNMAFSIGDKVQGPLSFAIIDEVDSILIDEARTPLIISGAAEDSSALYMKINQLVPQFVRQPEKESQGDFYVDEKNKQVFLSEEGHNTAERLMREAELLKEEDSLYDASNILLMHHLYAGLRAHALYQVNVDYIVQNNEVVIVDEHTGRTMPGRRWSDGLHQAVEAKENVRIQNENQTLASITFQNFFRMYDKISGMTGTADTEAYELHQIYNLEVVVIPTNKPIARKDSPDLVYMTAEEKFEAIIADIEVARAKGQPVLVGTVSIEVSEMLSRILNEKNIPHNVLNAKFHEKEAEIIVEAGRPGRVTIATNMAGRGTDIVLGGNVEKEIHQLENPSDEQLAKLRAEWRERQETVLAAGGLYVIGTERHESRRIDNQLRGRCGRQGDPGASRFYLSLDDALLRIFAAGRVKGLMSRMGVERGTSLESNLLSRCIENAQRKVESHNFDIRKQLLGFDDVANDQRQVVYQQRTQLMMLDDLSNNIAAMREQVVADVVEQYIPSNTLEEHWNIPGLEYCLADEFATKIVLREDENSESTASREEILDKVQLAVSQTLAEKEAHVGADIMRSFEKTIMLQTLDSHWKEHLAAMDYLRQGIHLRSYAQKDPKQEYKKEAFVLFTRMLTQIKREVVSILCSFRIQSQEDAKEVEDISRHEHNYTVSFEHDEMDSFREALAGGLSGTALPLTNAKAGRNDPCPCGSGKKFKQCHGAL
ncbi:MAG: preprotein translocase subunit SecA [Gammaproteobacteria bacterium]|nr:preprotein translocase subunit SecA [Gammaproteobacteria bacterium]